MAHLTSSEIKHALRRKFGTARDALRHLGLDPNLIAGKENTMSHYHRHYDRRARDDEDDDRRRERHVEDRERRKLVLDRLRRIADDREEDFDPQELIEVLAEHFPSELREAAEEFGADHQRRSLRDWARDRREYRRAGRDAHFARATRARRLGDDTPPDFAGMPHPGGRLSPLERHFSREEYRPDESRSVEDRRRHALDMAFDSGDSGLAAFAAAFGNQAAGIARK